MVPDRSQTRTPPPSETLKSVSASGSRSGSDTAGGVVGAPEDTMIVTVDEGARTCPLAGLVPITMPAGTVVLV